MNKRTRDLVVLIMLMSISIVVLCACMTDRIVEGDPSATTMDPGYGVATSFPTIDTIDESTEDKVFPTEQENSNTTESIHTTTATTPTTGQQTTSPAPGSLSYEEFLKLSTDEQRAYALTFSSVNDYTAWFNAEKEKYENDQVIEITGPVDLGEIAGKNG